eukprot:257221-Alexandrium_andersonii.AAC.1
MRCCPSAVVQVAEPEDHNRATRSNGAMREAVRGAMNAAIQGRAPSFELSIGLRPWLCLELLPDLRD